MCRCGAEGRGAAVDSAVLGDDIRNLFHVHAGRFNSGEMGGRGSTMKTQQGRQDTPLLAEEGGSVPFRLPGAAPLPEPPAPTQHEHTTRRRAGGLAHSLLLTDLSARAKSPFWPQRFTSLHSAAAAPGPPAAAAAISEPGGEQPRKRKGRTATSRAWARAARAPPSVSQSVSLPLAVAVSQQEQGVR